MKAHVEEAPYALGTSAVLQLAVLRTPRVQTYTPCRRRRLDPRTEIGQVYERFKGMKDLTAIVVAAGLNTRLTILDDS